MVGAHQIEVTIIFHFVYKLSVNCQPYCYINLIRKVSCYLGRLSV